MRDLCGTERLVQADTALVWQGDPTSALGANEVVVSRYVLKVEVVPKRTQ